ncbi:MAG TPA: flagellar basal body rod protein FlgB [Methylomirabilota bacterium]|nr:flagellar basal body rod protein FlgB [Methylomirabilota bacterium]
MIGFKLFNFTQQLLELSLRVRAARHEILSANVANADTPGYRPRDLDFKTIMQTAVSSGEQNLAGAGPRRDIDPKLATDLLPSMVYPVEDNRHGEDRLDGNAVSLDRQMALLTENALAHEASLTLLSRTLASLRYAIGEGRR